MKLIKLTNLKDKEESAFARSKTFIPYKLEEEKQKEHVNIDDNLPLLDSSGNVQETSNFKSPSKSKNSKKKFLKIKPDTKQGNPEFSSANRKNRLKLRNRLFSGSKPNLQSSKKKKKSHSRRPSDLDTLPILSFSSRDSESQADEDERGLDYEIITTATSVDDMKTDDFQNKVHTVQSDPTFDHDDLDFFFDQNVSRSEEVEVKHDTDNVLNELKCLENKHYETTKVIQAVRKIEKSDLQDFASVAENKHHETSKENKTGKKDEKPDFQPFGSIAFSPPTQKSPEIVDFNSSFEMVSMTKAQKIIMVHSHSEIKVAKSSKSEDRMCAANTEFILSPTAEVHSPSEKDFVSKYCNDSQSIKTIKTGNLHDDDDATVITVKCSNCTYTEIGSKSSSEKPETKPLRRKQKSKGSSGRKATSKEENRRRRCKKALKIYSETLKLDESEFKDSVIYHSTMFTSATKMAQVLISIEECKAAKKYLDIARFHSSKRRFDYDDSTSSSDSDCDSDSESESDSGSESSCRSSSSDESSVFSDDNIPLF